MKGHRINLLGFAYSGKFYPNLPIYPAIDVRARSIIKTLLRPLIILASSINLSNKNKNQLHIHNHLTIFSVNIFTRQYTHKAGYAIFINIHNYSAINKYWRMTGKYKIVYNLRNDLVVCFKHIEKRESVKSVFVTDQVNAHHNFINLRVA